MNTREQYETAFSAFRFGGDALVYRPDSKILKRIFEAARKSYLYSPAFDELFFIRYGCFPATRRAINRADAEIRNARRLYQLRRQVQEHRREVEMGLRDKPISYLQRCLQEHIEKVRKWEQLHIDQAAWFASSPSAEAWYQRNLQRKQASVEHVRELIRRGH